MSIYESIYESFSDIDLFSACILKRREGKQSLRAFVFFFLSSALETARCLYDRRLLLRPTVELPAQQVHNSFGV